MADAALGASRRAQERRVVVLVDEQPQPRAQVADLGAVEEARAARDLVRNLRRAQLLLEDARLMVGAIEDREVAEPDLSALRTWVGFRPATSIETGVARFVEWYRDYYRV